MKTYCICLFSCHGFAIKKFRFSHSHFYHFALLISFQNTSIQQLCAYILYILALLEIPSEKQRLEPAMIIADFNNKTELIGYKDFGLTRVF